jgi:hypothetical protein
MKLRFQSNSLRLRLKKSEVERLVREGRLEESVAFGEGAPKLTYRLETVEAEEAPQARFEKGTITVRVSGKAARRWAEGEEIAIEGHQPITDGHGLHLLIEKDFACLDGSDEENEDTFPHPLAGTKC